MDFFKQLADLDPNGQYLLNIVFKDGQTTLSVMFLNPDAKDKALAGLPPFLAKGTPDELDQGFIEAIKAPVEQVAGLVVSTNAFIDQMELVKKRTQEATQTAAAEARAKAEGKKKYDAALLKVAEMEDAGRFREAYGKLPNEAEFPDFADQIKAKRKTLSARFSQGNLFDTVTEPAPLDPLRSLTASTSQQPAELAVTYSPDQEEEEVYESDDL